MDLNLSLTQGAKYEGTEEDYMSGSRLTITEHLKKLRRIVTILSEHGAVKEQFIRSLLEAFDFTMSTQC